MAIALIQSAKGNGKGYNNSASLELSNNVAAGHLLVLTLTAGNENTISSIVDNRGNSWQLAVSQDGAGTGRKSWIFYAPNTAAGATTLTVTFGANQFVDVAMIVREYSGLRTFTPLNVVAHASDMLFPTTHLSSISPSTTDAVELVVTAIGSPGAGDRGVNDPVFAAGSGYSNLLRQSGADVYTYAAMADLITTQAGDQVAIFTSSLGVNAQTILATFRQPAVAGANHTKALSETQPATDVQSKTIKSPRPDAVSPVDQTSRRVLRPISDSTAVTDVQGFGSQNYTRLLGDAAVLADVMTTRVGRRPTDAVTPTDVIRKRARPRRTESIVTLDVVAKTLQKALNDAVSTTDYAGGQIRVRALEDSLAASDAVTRRISKYLSDGATVVDQRGEGNGRSLALVDSIELTDATAKNVRFTRADTFIASDAAFGGSARSINLSDTSFSLDSRLTMIAKQVVEVLVTADSNRKRVTHPLVDELSPVDAMAVAGALKLDLLDLVQTDDQARRAVRVALYDALTLTDRVDLPSSEPSVASEATILRNESNESVTRVDDLNVLLTNDSSLTILRDKGI